MRYAAAIALVSESSASDHRPMNLQSAAMPFEEL